MVALTPLAHQEERRAAAEAGNAPPCTITNPHRAIPTNRFRVNVSIHATNLETILLFVTTLFWLT